MNTGITQSGVVLLLLDTILVLRTFFLLVQATGGLTYSIKYFTTFYIITDNSDGQETHLYSELGEWTHGTQLWVLLGLAT